VLAQYAPPVYPTPQAVHPAPPAYAMAGASDSAPQDYRTAGIFLLVGGITTSLASLVIVGLTIWFCIGVCWIPTLLGGIWALVSGIQASNGTRVRNIRIANALGLVAAIFCADVVGIVMNILAMVWLSRDGVASWIEARS
jgi:hypothetical protein